MTIRETTNIAELIHLDVRRLPYFPLRKSVGFMLRIVDDYIEENLGFCVEAQI